jgi:ribosomal protein S26
MKLHCVKCGRLLPKDEGAKSLLPFEVYRCRNCGDGMIFDMAINQIPYDKDY